MILFDKKKKKKKTHLLDLSFMWKTQQNLVWQLMNVINYRAPERVDEHAGPQTMNKIKWFGTS